MNQQVEYQEVTDTLEVPRHAGVEGFILALRGVLRQPRVVTITIDARGKVTFTRFARKEEPRKHVELDFETVSPSAILRNGQVLELDLEAIQGNAAVCIAYMFGRASKDKMYPVGWVGGANSQFFMWHKSTTGIEIPEDFLYGLPFYRDRFIPDESLLLACAYGPDAALIDTQLAYKIVVPTQPAAVETPGDVEVLQ